jgi:hypothetical protein
MTWHKYPDGCSDTVVNSPVGRLVAVTWYHEGAHLWRVTWDGFLVRNGTGCIDGAEARREADAVIAACEAGDIDPPWAKFRERQALEQQILDGRARKPADADVDTSAGIPTSYFGPFGKP